MASAAERDFACITVNIALMPVRTTHISLPGILSVCTHDLLVDYAAQFNRKIPFSRLDRVRAAESAFIYIRFRQT